MSTKINERHRAIFEALISGEYANFALFSCFVNGKPGAEIIAFSQDKGPGDEITMTLLFVSVTDDMILTDHDGHAA